MRNQRGITLIALVITIIVLLILAGVSIAMLTGDNGILTNANESARETAISTAREEVALAVNEGITNYYNTVYVDDQEAAILDSIDAELSTVTASYTTAKDKVTMVYTKTAAPYTVAISYDGDLVTTASISSTGALTWDDEATE